MKLKTKITLSAGSAVAVFGLILVLMSILRSQRIDRVTVTFVGPGEEVRDKAILGIGKEDVAPDYRLDLVHTRGKHNCGTVLNRSAADGIAFAVAKDIPLAHVQELVLIEDDKLVNDTIARVQFAGATLSANGYTFQTETSRSFKVGLNWFFSTPVGKAISLGITIGIAVVIVAVFLRG